MKNDSKIQNLNWEIKQLRRALTNPNLAASYGGSPENKAALERIRNKEKEIEALSAEPEHE